MGRTNPDNHYTPVSKKIWFTVLGVIVIISAGAYLKTRKPYPPRKFKEDGEYVCVTSSDVMHDRFYDKLSKQWIRKVKIASPSDAALQRLIVLKDIEEICIEHGFFDYAPDAHKQALKAIPASAVRDISLIGQWAPEDITTIERLTELDVVVAKNVSELEFLRKNSHGPSLTIAMQRELDAWPAEDLSKLESLYLCNGDITNLSQLKHCTRLKSLSIDRTKARDISPLAHCTQLEYLNIESFRNTDLSPLANCPRLNEIELSYYSTPDCTPLGGLTKIRSLDEARFRDPVAYGRCRNLQGTRRLRFDHWPEDNNFEPLRGIKEVQHLIISDCSKMTDVESFASIDWPTSLHRITFHKIKNDVDLRPLARLNCVLNYDFLDCDGLTSLAFCKDKQPSENAWTGTEPALLWRISVDNCPNFRDLSTLSGASVNDLNFHHCQGIKDVSGLVDMRQLGSLKFRSCNNIKNLLALKEIETLYNLDIRTSENIPDKEYNEVDRFLDDRNKKRRKARAEEEAKAQAKGNSRLPPHLQRALQRGRP